MVTTDGHTHTHTLAKLEKETSVHIHTEHNSHIIELFTPKEKMTQPITCIHEDTTGNQIDTCTDFRMER